MNTIGKFVSLLFYHSQGASPKLRCRRGDAYPQPTRRYRTRNIAKQQRNIPVRPEKSQWPGERVWIYPSAQWQQVWVRCRGYILGWRDEWPEPPWCKKPHKVPKNFTKKYKIIELPGWWQRDFVVFTVWFCFSPLLFFLFNGLMLHWFGSLCVTIAVVFCKIWGVNGIFRGFSCISERMI